MKTLGRAKKILGMQIVRDESRDHLGVSQRSYLLKVLDKFQMKDAKSISTLTASHFRLTSKMSECDDIEVEFMKRVPYANAVGSIMYAMIYTRPELAYASSLVSIFISNPGKRHWDAVNGC